MYVAVEATGNPRMLLLIGIAKAFLFKQKLSKLHDADTATALVTDNGLPMVLLCLVFQELVKKFLIVCS